MTGYEGPYMDPNGPDVWVPRTVPYLRAREIAKEALDYSGDRIVYVGKGDATLFGFTGACDCDEACAIAERADEGEEGVDWDACLVPAWHFRVEER